MSDASLAQAVALVTPTHYRRQTPYAIAIREGQRTADRTGVVALATVGDATAMVLPTWSNDRKARHDQRT